MSWSSCQLDDLLSCVIDYRGKTPPKTDSGIRLITAKVIKKGRVINDGSQEYIDPSMYGEVMRRGVPVKNDIFITTEAPLGELALWNSEEQIALAQRVILLRPDPDKIDPNFLFYYLQSEVFQAQLHANSTGTTVPGIKNPVLRSLFVKYPRLETQRKIGSVLARYDAFMEANRHRVALLEESARLLYQEWLTNMRFPGYESVDSFNGIPAGWSYIPLSGLAEVNQATLKLKDAPASIRYIDISSVGVGIIKDVGEIPFSQAPGRARRLVRHGDVIWSCVRPERKSYAMIWDPSENVVVSTGLAVISPVKVPFTFLYLAVTSDEFVTHLSNRATGVAYPAVTAKDFEVASILVPDQATLDELHLKCEPLFAMINCLSLQIDNLTKARNALLPQLMSGAIQV